MAGTSLNIHHVPDIIVGANELLKDDFVNLIANAVKHSDEEKPLTINVKAEPVKEYGKNFTDAWSRMTVPVFQTS